MRKFAGGGGVAVHLLLRVKGARKPRRAYGRGRWSKFDISASWFNLRGSFAMLWVVWVQL